MSQVGLAIDVPRWALRFYARHAAVIVGLSLVPSAQRFVTQQWDLPAPLAWGSEALVLAVRLLLLYVIVRLAILAEPRLRGLNLAGAWARVRRFARRHWPSLLLQAALLAVVFVVFELVPDQIVGPRVPQRWENDYWAWLLAIKNPTVVAFTIVWWVAALRQALLCAGEPAQFNNAGEPAGPLNAGRDGLAVPADSRPPRTG